MKNTKNINLHFSLYNDLYIKVDCDDKKVILGIDEFLTSHVKGYLHMPKYKSGVWDGKISLFRKPTRSFPYGLFFDVINCVKEIWGDVINITIAQEIRDMYGYNNKPTFVYDLLYKPYPYQQEVIESMVKHTKGLSIVATAGGKSLIISYIITNLPKTHNKSLIIVPTLQLVDQFKYDMIEYGISKDKIGQVNGSKKEFDKEIVVSTWQSLTNQIDKLSMFDAVICDECLDGDTLITIPGGMVKIKDVKIGDEIVSYDIDTKCFVSDIVKNVFVNNPISSNEDMYELVFDDGSVLNVTGNHKILTDRGYIEVKELSFDDNIISL